MKNVRIKWWKFWSWYRWYFRPYCATCTYYAAAFQCNDRHTPKQYAERYDQDTHACFKRAPWWVEADLTKAARRGTPPQWIVTGVSPEVRRLSWCGDHKRKIWI